MITLIHGPRGTGKTFTANSLREHSLVQYGESTAIFDFFNSDASEIPDAVAKITTAAISHEHLIVVGELPRYLKHLLERAGLVPDRIISISHH